MGLPSARWLACFILGISMETPMASFTLAIDYYEMAFPGLLLSVKLQACYSFAFVTMQMTSHLLDSRLPLSRAQRIRIRHVAVACLLALTILWEHVMIGPVLGHSKMKAAAPLLLGVVTLIGILDGMAMGAIFGEAAVLDPTCAHAVVAGNAAVLPLLSCMRIAFKGALTEMHNGLRLSVNLYFATATIVVLIAGAVYMIVVRPAVAAVMMDVDDQQLPCFCKQVSALMRHQSDCIIKRNKLEDTIQDWSGHDAIIVLQGQTQTKVEDPLEPRYFTPGQSVWRSNVLMLQDNWPYVLAVLLAPMCTYGIFPSFVDLMPRDPTLGSWYPVLMVAVYGWADLLGKLVPAWHPRWPKATMLCVSFVRIMIFFPLFAVALWLRLGPWAFFISVFLLGFTAGYEATIFHLAVEDHHPDDAYQTDSMLALTLDFGLALGSIVSLAWDAGPWVLQVAMGQ